MNKDKTIEIVAVAKERSEIVAWLEDRMAVLPEGEPYTDAVRGALTLVWAFVGSRR